MNALQSLLELFLALLLGAPVHPHNPKALIVQGAGGTATVTYMTVPYNAERLSGLKAGYVWHLGYAALETEVPLESGGKKIAAGKYKLNVVRGESGDDWSVRLEPYELIAARMAVAGAQRREQRAQGAELEQAKARVKEAQDALARVEKEKGAAATIDLAAETLTMPHDEHLTMSIVFGGYATQKRGEKTPAGGMELSLRFSFGDLHRAISLQEVFPAEGARDR